MKSGLLELCRQFGIACQSKAKGIEIYVGREQHIKVFLPLDQYLNESPKQVDQISLDANASLRCVYGCLSEKKSMLRQPEDYTVKIELGKNAAMDLFFLFPPTNAAPKLLSIEPTIMHQGKLKIAIASWDRTLDFSCSEAKCEVGIFSFGGSAVTTDNARHKIFYNDVKEVDQFFPMEIGAEVKLMVGQ